MKNSSKEASPHYELQEGPTFLKNVVYLSSALLQFFKLFLTWCIIFNMGNANFLGSQSPKIELSNATNIGLKAEVIYDVENDQTVSRYLSRYLK